MNAEDNKPTTVTPEMRGALQELLKTMLEMIKLHTDQSVYGGMPSGELYAILGLQLDIYENIIAAMIEAEKIRRTDGHLLVWLSN